MISTPKTPKALVLGPGITALGTIRALAPAGVPCMVLDDGRGLASRSRWYRAAPPLGAFDLESYLKDLPEAPVVLPCSDDWVRTVSRLPKDRESATVASCSDPDVVDLFLDKGLFGGFLRRHSIPHPTTHKPAELSDVPEGTNLFLKPRDSQSYFRAFGEKAFWPGSRAELAQRVEEVSDLGIEVVLQEYVPGPASNHVFLDGFVDSQGALRAIFARRRLRMSPPRFGNSTFMVSITPSEASQAVTSMKAILEHSGYRGIFSAEFKQDERDGIFKILETNIRPWWFVQFAASCGVNVVKMAWEDAQGFEVADTFDYRVGKTFSHPYYDWFACRAGRPGFVGATMLWVGSMLGAEKPVFQWSDPGPGLSEAMRLGWGYLRRRLPGLPRP